jgi:Flp pilus assembly protein TadB
MTTLGSLCAALGVVLALAHRVVTTAPRRLGDPHPASRVSSPTTQSPRRSRLAGLRSPVANVDDRDEICARQSLEFLARSIRAGRTLRGAFEELARSQGGSPPLRDWIEPALVSMRGGATLHAAVSQHSPGPRSSSGERLWYRAMSLASRPGVLDTRVLEYAATTAGDRVENRRERRAHAAQAVLSARVLGVVPVGTVTLAATFDPEIRRILTTTPTGAICLGAGLGLGWAGRRWIRRIVRGPSP